MPDFYNAFILFIFRKREQLRLIGPGNWTKHRTIATDMSIYPAVKKKQKKDHAVAFCAIRASAGRDKNRAN